MKILKRNGTIEDFDAEKINSMCEWSIGDTDVNWSEIAMEALKNVKGDVIKSSDIQKSLVKVCIEKEDIKYNKVAAMLVLGDIRKSTLADDDFVDFYYWMVENDYWRDMNYSGKDIMYLSQQIDHSIDKTYQYPTLRQFQDKYALRDENGYLLELPQYMYMGIAMSLFENDSIDDVVMYYNKAKRHKINIPSPILSTQRTNSNVGVSCVITTAGDSVQGIEATKHITSVATANSAGMGAEYDVRSPKDDVRKGYAKAGGKLPHYFVMDKLVKELKQSNRGGSCTVSFNCLDPEVKTLLNLKLKRSSETKRIDLLDYSFVINNDFLKRAAQKKPWALVSKIEAPELHNAFYNDRENFSRLMDEVLADESIKKTVVNALDILKQYLDNRQETGRIYRFNVDEVNNHTPFNETVRLSNLCQEVCLPTKPYNHITELYKTTYDEGDGITAQCFLSAIDVANIEDDNDYEETTYIALKALDNLLDSMDFPFPQFAVTARAYRSVGVGITNLAYKIAREGKSYRDVENLHDISERHYYFLLKASVRLSKERGCFDFIGKTKWRNGWIPYDTYNVNVDNIVANKSRYNWEQVRSELMMHGVRFSTISTHMPCESSSVLTASTNSVYPIRHKMVYKDSKSGKVQFFAPKSDVLYYENAFDVDPYDILNMYAIIQKFNDQSISADTYLNLSRYPNNSIPKSEQIKLFLYGNKIGVKTLYYNNTRTGRGEGSAIEAESDCEGCSL